MSFDITDYKLKHIVSLKEGYLNDTYVNLPIEGNEYKFKIDQARSEIIELVIYFKYDEVKSEIGPLEKILKGYTYGKNYRELNDHELYEIRFSKFNAKIDGKSYKFEITGAGPTALKVSLFLTYKIIEKEETSLEKFFKELILKEYSDIINNNPSYREKLKILKEEDEKKQAEIAKLDEEIRREQEEKERKWRELEARLNSNKP